MAENVCPDSGLGFLLYPDAILAFRGEQLLRAWVHSQTKLASDQPHIHINAIVTKCVKIYWTDPNIKYRPLCNSGTLFSLCLIVELNCSRRGPCFSVSFSQKRADKLCQETQWMNCFNFYINGDYRLLIPIAMRLRISNENVCFFLNVSPGPFEKTINVSITKKL